MRRRSLGSLREGQAAENLQVNPNDLDREASDDLVCVEPTVGACMAHDAAMCRFAGFQR